MKNKIKIIYLCLVFYFFNSIAYSLEKFYYEANKIDVLDNGNILISDDSVRIIINENIEIVSDKFKYNKKIGLVELNGNIKINDKLNKLRISANKVFYSEIENKIYSRNFTDFEFEEKYFAESQSFNYFINTSKVTSDEKMKIYDNLGNIFYIDNFSYEIKKNFFKGSNTRYIDKEKNEYLISDTLVNLKDQKILGKDLNINFNKSIFKNNENDPRLKAKSFYLKDDISSMNKSVFTTCKKNDKCPPWKIYADNITHNKKDQMLKYKNAWLKIYDIPVAYFPKFSHPDPTVDRKSGFLNPVFMNSSTHGFSLSVPYYMVISENKDLTFTPRLYGDGQNIIQNEYRQTNKDSKHVVDLGMNNSKLLGSNNQTKSHFFSNSFFDLDLSGYDNANLELNIQKTTNDTYLKTYKINSPLIDNTSLLNSYLSFNAEKNNLSFTSTLEVWDDLSKNSSDRYEFVYPNYKVLKKFDLKDNNLSLSSYGHQKKYDTNKYEGIVTNDLFFEEDSEILDWGLRKNLSLLLKNVNTESTNSAKYKEGFDQSILTSLLYSGEYPLKKENKKYEDKITPKFSIMYSPNKTKNMSAEDKRIDINNIYSFNRIGVTDTVEGGASVTLGTEYTKTNKKNYEDFINLNIATILRNKKNEDLSEVSTLGDTHSNFFGNFELTPNENFKIDYNFALDNNLTKSNYDAIKTNLSVNNFVTSFEYIDDKKNKNQRSYITNNSSLSVDKNNSVGFNIRRNNDISATEFYDLYYSYSNDCLKAAVSFNKSYYSDSDLKPEKQLFFSISIIPFGEISSPNLNY